MNNDLKSFAEKRLKSFLKKNKIGYTTSLLTIFLITGSIGLSFGASAVEQQKQQITEKKTQNTKTKILLDRDKKVKLHHPKSIENRNLYLKPDDLKIQVLFNFQYENSEKAKNRTTSEWKEIHDTVKKMINAGAFDLGVVKKKYIDDYIAGRIFAEELTELIIKDANGAVSMGKPMVSSMELGVHIVPLSPETPEISRNVQVDITPPSTPDVSVNSPTITPPSLNINFIAPSSISPITPPSVTEPIINTPSPVTPINISITTPNPPSVPVVRIPTVSPNIIALEIEPSTISIPKAPVIVPPSLPSMPNIPTASGGANPNVEYYWWDGNRGVISQILLESGQYDITGEPYAYTINISGIPEANAFVGTTPLHEFPKIGTYQVEQMFFHTLVNVGYSHYGENVIINYNVDEGQIVNNEVEGNVDYNLSHYIENKYISSADAKRYKDYQTKTEIRGEDDTELLFVNKGIININGAESSYFYVTVHTDGAERTSYIDNSGVINANGEGSLIISHTPDINIKTAHIYINSGTGIHSVDESYENGMYVNGKNSKLIAWSNRHDIAPASFVNDGIVKLQGVGTYGLIFSRNRDTHPESNAYIKVPIIITGDGATGVIFQNTNVINSKNLVKFDIGTEAQNSLYGNDPTLPWPSALSKSSDPYRVEQAIGVYHATSGTTTKTAAEIIIGAHADTSVGIYIQDGKLNVIQNQHESIPTQSQIIISGGNENIGILAKGGYIDYQGDTTILGGASGGDGHKAVVVQGMTKISLFGKVHVGTSSDLAKNTTVLYADDGGEIEIYEPRTIESPVSNGNYLKIFASGESIGAYAASATEATSIISINRNITPVIDTYALGANLEPRIKPDIYIEGIPSTISEFAKGVALFASTNGQINSKNTYIKVKNGATAVAAIGIGAHLNLEGSIIDYEGTGYAVYSDGNGTVNLTNGEIVLRGAGVAVEATIGGISPIILTGTRITMMSNDATAAILKIKDNGELNLTTSSLSDDVGMALGGVTIKDGTDGINVYDMYKIAATDGGNMLINSNISKTDALGTDGYMYFRRFLGQRESLTVSENITVKAELNSVTDSPYKNQVVALEMNSSDSAIGVGDTQINLSSNSKIISDRIDSGNGAVGLFINFGQINTNLTSKIIVEKGKNIINNEAVGVMAINGSEVKANGIIEVGGNNSVGIFGQAYRTEDGITQVDEFKSEGNPILGQGKIDIINKGIIDLDGDGTFGIYADNNNPSTPTVENAKIVNDTIGIINVRNNQSIGMYANHAIMGNKGTINVGTGSIGMYTKAGTHSQIDDIGTINLGAGSIGVMADETTKFDSNITANINGILGESSSKSGILISTSIDGRLQAMENPINININTKLLEKGSAFAVKELTNFESQGTLNIGKNGVGIYLDNGSAKNSGKIELPIGSERAIGMYTANGTIENAGNIYLRENSNNTSQLGMYIDGTADFAVASNLSAGNIYLGADNLIGIYAKGSNAVVNLKNGHIHFNDENKTNTRSGIGVFAASSLVTLHGISHISDNANKNILIYALDSARIENNAPFIINGNTISGDDKTIGIYLNGLKNTYIENKSMLVENGAVGIYSNGNNNLQLNTTVRGDKTVGVYIDGGSTLEGNIDVIGLSGEKAVGIYGTNDSIKVVGNGLKISLGDAGIGIGTGVYLTNSSHLTGTIIEISNNSATDTNIGIYYNDGPLTKTTHETDVILSGDNPVIGLAISGGMTLTNNNKIIYAGTGATIGTYVKGNSTYNQNSISDHIITDNSVGILVSEGVGINNETLKVANSSSSAMVANGGDNQKAIIENAGTLMVDAGVGMSIGNALASSNMGKNAGIINVKSGAVGVYLSNKNSHFDGKDGIIFVNPTGAGVYLDKTEKNQIQDIGTLRSLGGAVGVFAKESVVDFPVTLTGSGGIGVYATGTKTTPVTILGTIDASGSQNTIGVYITNNYVTFDNALVKTGSLLKGQTPVGIYLDTALNDYKLDNVTVEATSFNSAAIYNGTSKTTTLASNAAINISNGAIGVYVSSGSKLETQGGILNINNGIGIVLAAGSIGEIGTKGDLNINFGTGGGTAIYNTGGVLNLGTLINITGTGSLAATKDGNLVSGAVLTVDGSVALSGEYTVREPHKIQNTSTGDIIVIGGGVGIGVTGLLDNANVDVINDGVITSHGKNDLGSPSVGIYTELAQVKNNNVINVGQEGVGIYTKGTNQDIISNKINLVGGNSIGLVLDGIIGNITSSKVTGSISDGIGIFMENATTGIIDLGLISLGNESVGVVAKNTTTSIKNGKILVGNSDTSSAVGILANGGTSLSMEGVIIAVGNRAIAVAAKDVGTSITGVDQRGMTVGDNGVSLYVENGARITLAGVGPLLANNNIGVIIEGSGVIKNITSIDVSNGGVGAFFIGASSDISTINIYAGTEMGYSVGAYYKNVTTPITLPTLNQSGSYTIGAVLQHTSANLESPIFLSHVSDTNQMGVVSKGKSDLIISLNTSNVLVLGDKNIGIFGEYSHIISEIVSVGTSHASKDKSLSSIGIDTINGSIATKNVIVDDNSIGLYGESLLPEGISVTGEVTTGNGAVGIYGTGTGTEPITIFGGLTVGQNGSVGIYGKNVNITVSPSKIIAIGNGTSVGIVSEGNGNIMLSGDLNISNQESSSGSIGIYKKNGGGNISTSGMWTVGDSGYGIYATTTMGDIVINNSADMILNESGIGIYAYGNIEVYNNGKITVGSTYLGSDPSQTNPSSHENSLAMYLKNGAKGENTGTIIVDKEYSVGVYGAGVGTLFENKGNIIVDNGGIGIFVKNGAIGINSGVITVKNNSSSKHSSVGITAHLGSLIINETTGIINVDDGVGMLVAIEGTLENKGVINVVNGIGIQGRGTIINDGGIINILGTGSAIDTTRAGDLTDGSVVIKNDGTVVINGNYVTVNGAFVASQPIELNGPYVDITNFKGQTVPLFSAPTVNGDINLSPNFATLGNGYYWKISDFYQSLAKDDNLGTIHVKTSPIFISNIMQDGSLIIVKRPYADIIIGQQHDELYSGLDSLLKKDAVGTGKDSLILKNLNLYLDRIYQSAGEDKSEFYRKTSQMLAETRGDVYSTIQVRMEKIQESFDNSFNELLDSYNSTKNTGKFSVMYSKGTFKDDTVGIDNFDYKVQGLLYMREFEGKNNKNKKGYNLGFAISKFEFDDGLTYRKDSKEDAYSLRAGVYNVHNFGDRNTFRLISRLELGYNRHETERVMELDRIYKNKGKYDSYMISLDNRFEKSLYGSFSTKVDLFTGLYLEYGRIDGFREKGDGLELQMKDNDYFSIQPEIGIRSERRYYPLKSLSFKIFAEGAYIYELGDSHDRNKIRVKNGTENWYELIKTAEKKRILKGRAGITLEKIDRVGVTFEVETIKHDNKEDTDTKYNIKLKYTF